MHFIVSKLLFLIILAHHQFSLLLTEPNSHVLHGEALGNESSFVGSANQSGRPPSHIRVILFASKSQIPGSQIPFNTLGCSRRWQGLSLQDWPSNVLVATPGPGLGPGRGLAAQIWCWPGDDQGSKILTSMFTILGEGAYWHIFLLERHQLLFSRTPF